jgi:hypothetical protein
MIIQVHEQKGDVRRHVRIAETPVELDTVEDGNFFSQADMLKVEVSVAIANLPVGDPLLEEGKMVLQEAASGPDDLPV